jgi:membrane protease subunit (stomatin/prohibitin family)
MGIIRASIDAIRGGLADQWLEVIEPHLMSDTTVMTSGVKVRAKDARNNNNKGTDRTVSNGSIIHVYPNQFMVLLDGGKVVDFTAEEGYYKVDNSTLPSMFSGQFENTLMDVVKGAIPEEALQRSQPMLNTEIEDTVLETVKRIMFGGVASGVQQVYYINLQEIKGIKFGTRNAINYFDNFYNAELFLRAHGSYSIKIVDPLKFFVEVIPRDKTQVDINDINEQYLSEFLTAIQAAINQMSADGIRISLVISKSMELAKYMSSILDNDWSQMRGMQIQSVGIASISYDDESKELLNMRNQGAMLQDPAIREGYVQGSAARGLEAAGSNANGSMNGFMGVGLGMQSAGSYMSTTSQTNQSQMQQAQNKLQTSWNCSCGTINTGNFCTNCGQKRLEKQVEYCCSKCGFKPSNNADLPKFCPECGDPFNENDKK